MLGFEAAYPDMVEPAYILFESGGSGEFAFGCVTGRIGEASTTETTYIGFSWDGNDEWTASTVMATPIFNQTTPCTEKSASIMAPNIRSSPKNGLLRKPARIYSC